MPTVIANLDTTQYVKVTLGGSSVILQAHRDTVRVVFSNDKPTKDNSAFHEIGGEARENILTLQHNSLPIWVLALTEESSLSITEESEPVRVTDSETDRAAFGETVVAKLTPEVQISAVNGLRSDVQQIFSGGDASVSVVGNNYTMDTGTNPVGFSSILSNRYAAYRNGQGLRGRFTALFPDSHDNSIQLAGLINAENSFAFGRNGKEYGIVRAYGGVTEYQKLQVTTPSGNENATVTVDGIGYTVPLTSGTVEHNAYEITVSLNSQVPNYTFTSNSDTVEALAAVPIAAGTFAFSSATAVATWSQITVGAAATFDWVPQKNWSHPPSWTVDPTKGNVYQIKVQFLGYGGITFWMENPATTKFELVHIYGYANENTETSVGDPTFRIGWAAQNLGNTNNIRLQGASAGAFVEGDKLLDEPSRSVAGKVTGLGSTRTMLLAIRNRLVMNDSVNRAVVYPKLLVLSADHNKQVIFHLDINSTVTDDLNFTYVDEQNSSVEVATDNAQGITNGREVLTVPIRGINNLPIDMEKVMDELLPRQTLYISVETPSGTTAEADASLTFKEDL